MLISTICQQKAHERGTFSVEIVYEKVKAGKGSMVLFFSFFGYQIRPLSPFQALPAFFL